MSTFKKSAFNDIASWISGKKDIQSFLDVGTCSAALPICVKLRNPDLDVYGIDVKDFFSQNTPVISNIGMEIGEHFFCAGMDELAHELNESDDLFFDCIAITGVVHAFKLGNPRPAGLKNLLNLAPSRCKYFICDNASWVTNMFQDQGAIFEVIKKIEMVPPEGTGSEWTYDGLFIIRF